MLSFKIRHDLFYIVSFVSNSKNICLGISSFVMSQIKDKFCTAFIRFIIYIHQFHCMLFQHFLLILHFPRNRQHEHFSTIHPRLISLSVIVCRLQSHNRGSGENQRLHLHGAGDHGSHLRHRPGRAGDGDVRRRNGSHPGGTSPVREKTLRRGEKGRGAVTLSPCRSSFGRGCHTGLRKASPPPNDSSLASAQSNHRAVCCLVGKLPRSRRRDGFCVSRKPRPRLPQKPPAGVTLRAKETGRWRSHASARVCAATHTFYGGTAVKGLCKIRLI